jgi:3-deoxy-7-phosphoheptulonate synthase
MFVVMKSAATEEQVNAVMEKIKSLGYTPNRIIGSQRNAIGITGNQEKIDPAIFLTMGGVAEAIPVVNPFKLVGREFKPDNTEIAINGSVVGGRELALIAGPCSVESREQILEIADFLASLGVHFLRGGAFKPRTSPYAFQGLKEAGLTYLDEARKKTGMRIVTEVKSEHSLPAITEVADVIQVGARNMQNFALLESVGSTGKPVLLKRGISATIEELLMAAEYIAKQGNPNIILCERGIRTFETYTRNTLDLNAVPVVKKLSHLPIIVDPSHGIGAWDGVPAMSMAAIAAGADGLMIEVHNDPEQALSDGYQSLKPKRFKTLMDDLERLAPVVGREIPAPKKSAQEPVKIQA